MCAVRLFLFPDLGDYFIPSSISASFLLGYYQIV